MQYVIPEPVMRRHPEWEGKNDVILPDCGVAY